MIAGRQEPTYAVAPDAPDQRTADEALELAAAAGITLLPWQADQVRRILGQRPDEEWAAPRAGLCVPRQNGKGVVLEVVVLAKAVLLGERVLWTAHEVRTMQESFTRFRAILEGTPDLARLVSASRVANGQEQITFSNGGQVKFSARSKSAARGLGFRTLIFDEAQELDYLTLGAIVPTLSGQGEARTQQILTGTPPYSRKGEVFTDTRAAAHSGGDDQLAWSEWSADPLDKIDDPKTWAKTNPSLGAVVRAEKIRDELAALSARPDVFRRERLGEWGRSGDTALALDAPQWAAGALPRHLWGERDPGYDYATSCARFLGVDTTYGAEMTSIVEAVPLGDGVFGLEVLAAAPGLDWLTAWFADMRTVSSRLTVGFDPLRTGDLTPDLTAAGLRPKMIEAATSRTLTLACDALVRGVREGRARHDDPRLDVAAGCATRSTFEDGRGWKLVGTEGGDVHVLIAGALALAALRAHRPRRNVNAERRAMVR